MEGNKEIIVRAVYGRTRLTFRKVIRMTYDEGSVLGCTICGANAKVVSIENVSDKSKKIKTEVQFDIHIWYRVDNVTKVIKMGTVFTDKFEIIKFGSGFYSNEEAFVWLKEDPRCLETIHIINPEKNQSAIQIEYTLGAEIIGDTALNVKVFET